MINELYIENFQSHKESILEFSQGMNLIVGQSDSGKTAILRALKWLITNRPGGDEFRSTWGGDTSVSIATKEGQTISRNKSKALNSYMLNDQEFVAFGQDVPDEIREVLNMDAVNLQEQMDSPFLLSETSGSVAAHFNKVANLELIDSTLNNVQKEINKLTKTISFNSDEIEAKKEQLTDFIDIDTVEKKLNKIQKKKEHSTKLKEDIKTLESVMTSLEETATDIEDTKELVKMGKDIDAVLLKFEKLSEAKKKANELKGVCFEIFYANQDIEKLKKLVSAEDDINKAVKHIKKREMDAQNLTNLKELCDTIESNNEAVKTALKTFNDLEQEYKDNLPELCPICNSKMK